MDLSTGMRYMIDVLDMYTIIILSVILFALLFSVINVMLMAVLERVREIGMLMAVGMARKNVFIMIILETIFLSLVGAAFGMLISWGLIEYYSVNGIDLGDAAYGDLGFSNKIYLCKFLLTCYNIFFFFLRLFNYFNLFFDFFLF